VEQTVTKRAKSYYQQLAQLKCKHAELGPLPRAPRKLHVAQVGDRILWPYKYVKTGKDGEVTFEVGFSQRTWLPHDALTPEFVERATKFVPRALFTGQVIRDYQQHTVPLMLYHLRIMFPHLYSELSAEIQQRCLTAEGIEKVMAPLVVLPPATYRVDKFSGCEWDGIRLTLPADQVSIISFYQPGELSVLAPDDAALHDKELIKELLDTGVLVRRWLF